MITKYDELFCHQSVSTFDRPGSSAREWTERAWLQAHEIGGRAHLATGFGYYPNRNVMDAYVCFTIGDETEYIVRASRELRPDLDVLEVGPFRYRVIEPLNKVCFSLDPNEHGREPPLRRADADPGRPGPPEGGHQAHGPVRPAAGLDPGRRRGLRDRP
jgi:hypothetical protein